LTAYGGWGQTGTMNHSRNPKDLNQLAASLVERATSIDRAKSDQNVTKDPAAVALGRKGGLKGGKARAEALSPKKRKEIARRAAVARWGDKKK
jgi:hypothetical protein